MTQRREMGTSMHRHLLAHTDAHARTESEDRGRGLGGRALLTLSPPSVTLPPPSVTLQTPSVTLPPPSVTFPPPSLSHRRHRPTAELGLTHAVTLVHVRYTFGHRTWTQLLGPTLRPGAAGGLARAAVGPAAAPSPGPRARGGAGAARPGGHGCARRGTGASASTAPTQRCGRAGRAPAGERPRKRGGGGGRGLLEGKGALGANSARLQSGWGAR